METLYSYAAILVAIPPKGTEGIEGKIGEIGIEDEKD
jgi:hypothetical protein